MKKLLGIVVLGLLWCNVGFANNDLTGVKLLCKETPKFKSWDIPFRTYEFINDHEYLYYRLNRYDLTISSSKGFYKADLRNIYIYTGQLEYHKESRDQFIIQRDTLYFIFKNIDSTFATCTVQKKNEDLKKRLEDELEFMKSKILEKNKI